MKGCKLMKKRVSCRGIIISEDKIAIMHRIKKDREYYVYPGGRLENDESKETAAIREIYEELGIEVDIKKLVYIYENNNTMQYFYLCDWKEGKFGTGQGPEMINPYEHKGEYIPTLYDLKDIVMIELEPKLLTKQLIADIKEFGVQLSDEVKKLFDKD